MSAHSRVENIVIIGGGTAGWMCAAGLSKLLGETGLNITLVESEAIPVIGVGEATLPHIKFFNDALGIDEAEFMRATSATFKLGIEFVNWGRLGDSYIHPFGDYGLSNNDVAFHHYWRKMCEHSEVGMLDEYSLPIMACRAGKFQPPSDDPRKVNSTYRYAYQFDSLKYAPFLRRHAQAHGVKRIEGKVVDVALEAETGQIESVQLESGMDISGDFFIDCTGFFGVLIEKAMQTGYDSWTDWLPCDRAVVAACERDGPLLPYTRATAQEAGWQWRIPLQHRTGNGYVYASEYISDDEAAASLLDNLEGSALAEPRFLRFETGKRRKLWNKNCVAIGLSGGFLEPLESTSIYLIQEGITKLIEHFPQSDDFTIDMQEYNRLMDLEFDRIRDFLILHYHATQRDDTPFWEYVRNMKIPASLEEKLNLFKTRGRVVKYDHGLFLHPSWVAVYIGQNILPRDYDWRVDQLSSKDVSQHLMQMRGLMAKTAEAMPDHETYLRKYTQAAM